jgi:hypothetical protein
MKRLGYLAALAALLELAVGCGSSRAPRTQPTAASADQKYHFLPGGILTLAQGRVQHGPAYAISVLRYRFQGKLGTDLQAQMEPHGKPTGATSNFTPRSREPFEWTTEQGCSKTATWSILYGLLRDPADRGVLLIGTRRHRLRTAPIPARFHLRGVLGYAALMRNPTRVIVRDGAGKVLQHEDLGRGPGGRCTPGESSSLMVLQKR